MAGLMSENGPFYPDKTGKLASNPYSWNTVANVFYLESPAGVGFSYCDSGCPTFDDNSTAADNYNVIVSFFQKYPKFAKNDFYIAGESYAGHYIPQIAFNIYLQLPINPGQAPQSNFKGFAAGNPLTDESYDFGDGIYTFYQTHGMIPLNQKSGQPAGKFNAYDMLVNICESKKISNHIRFPHPFFNKTENKKRDVPAPDPCIDDYVDTYLNRKDVKQAIHAKDVVWEECGGPNYRFGHDSMMPIYKTFFDKTTWNILVYSGDADTVLNFISTQQWVIDMNRPVKSKWTNWNYNDAKDGSQIGGWGIKYDRFTFKTIRGAGHMVPWFQPAPSLQLFKDFLSGK
jgi:serine carboxypeptidase-like clade 2